MFFPARMTRVRVLCPKRSVADSVEALYDFGMIHITPAKTFSAAAPLASFRVFSEKLVALRSLAASIGVEKEAPEELTEDALLRKWGELGVEEAIAWLKQKEELQAKLRELEDEKEKLLPFRHLRIRPELLFSPRVKALYFEPLPKWSLKVEHIKVEDEGRVFILVVYDARRQETEAKILEHAQRVYEIPRVDDFEKAFARLEAQKASVEASLKSVDSLIKRFVQRRRRELGLLLSSVELAAKKTELPAHFGESTVLASVEGWIPSARFAELERKLAKRLGECVLVEALHSREIPPTKLDNPRPIRPFEFLVNALSLPKYNEPDPTLLVFVSFPLFFGMILGDIGYGVALALLGLALRAKFSQGFFRTVGSMMILSAFWTIAFGYIFGEFLGTEHILDYNLTPIIHRAEGEGLLHLMQLSLLFGFIHLSLGFALGAFVAYREHHLKHALAKASWLLMLVSLVSYLSVVSHVEALEIFSPLASLLRADWLLIVGVALIGLLYSEGGNALFELPGLIGNLVSYLRIMALGVSGVVLASMVNQIPLRFSLEPFALLSFVLFALFFVFGHALTLALGIFESSIQSLRLHYVEFFSKFYHGGGVPFTPLKEKEVR